MFGVFEKFFNIQVEYLLELWFFTFLLHQPNLTTELMLIRNLFYNMRVALL